MCKNGKESNSGSEHAATLASTKHARSKSAASASDQPQKQTKASTSVQTSIKPHTYKVIDIPFSPVERDVVQAQALRAVISTNSAFGLFEDPEMQELFHLFRTVTPSVLPSGKSVGGKLLNDAAQSVEQKLLKTLKGQYVGLV